MNRRALATIVRKDLRVVVQSKAVLIPLIVVPLIMLVVLPIAFSVLAQFASGEALGDLRQLLDRMPAALRQNLATLTPPQQIVVLALGYMLAPMYLIVPLMVASVIAADSFAGEKERKTLEALLYTPTTDRELFLAKLLSAWLPALAVALGGFVAYVLVANIAAWPVMGRVFLPNAMWLGLLFWVAPAVAGLGLGITVLISSRVNTFQEAFQLGGVVVVPILALVIGQAVGLLYLSAALVLVLGLLLWLVDLALLWFGFRTFRRDRLAARL